MNIEIALPSKHTTYEIAWLYCLTLAHDGYKDWRLPTYLEYTGDESFRLCWYSDDEYSGERLWRAVPVRNVL